MVKLDSQQELVDRTHTVFMTMPSATSGYESRIQLKKKKHCRRVNNTFHNFAKCSFKPWDFPTIKREKNLATELSNSDYSNKKNFKTPMSRQTQDNKYKCNF